MRIGQSLRVGISIALLSLLAACGSNNLPQGRTGINSRYNDQQPNLSGNGQYLTWVSNRSDGNKIFLYNLSKETFEPLPGLNQNNIVAETPSLSLTGRYLVYLVSQQGKPEVALYDRIADETEIVTKNYNHWIRNPDVSLSGRYIVFETARRGQWDIEVWDRGPNVEPDMKEGERIYGTPGQ